MTRRPSRSRLLLAAGVAASVALSSCSTTGRGADAAKVGDHALADDDFQDLLADLAKLSVLESALVTDAEGKRVEPAAFTGDFARERLGEWISWKVMADDLAERGKPGTEAHRAGAEEQISQAVGDDEWNSTPSEVRDFLVETAAIYPAFADSFGDPVAAQAAYEQGIEGGYACVSHILVDTEEAAQDVVDQLAAGADFATLASTVSTDTGSGANGGVLTNQSGSPCMTSDEFVQTFVPEFSEGALDAEVGVPTQPVQSEFGYHIILLRPFDEVADVLVPLVADDAAGAALADLFDGVDVTVASRYGHWDAEQRAVVAAS